MSGGSLPAQGVDGVHPGGLGGGQQTEDQTDQDGEGGGHDDGRYADGRRRVHGLGEKLRKTDAAQDPQQTAQRGQHGGLRKELAQDAAALGAQGLFQSDLMGPLADATISRTAGVPQST